VKKMTRGKGLLLFFISCLLFISNSFAKEQSNTLSIRINMWERYLYVMEGDQIKNKFKIAIGREGTPTPIGEWKVTDKQKDWGGGFGPRWMRLSVPWGIYGIHGTSRPGTVGEQASEGCIRLYNKDVIKLYRMIPIGTKVIIEGPIFGFNDKAISLTPGKRGSIIFFIQNRLLAAGYYMGPVNGIFNKELERAIIQFQRDNGLEETGLLYIPEYQILGLLE
jgi:lipoprotein-anchoring transpeptidase ErfK/SrfK